MLVGVVSVHVKNDFFARGGYEYTLVLEWSATRQVDVSRQTDPPRAG